MDGIITTPDDWQDTHHEQPECPIYQALKGTSPPRKITHIGVKVDGRTVEPVTSPSGDGLDVLRDRCPRDGHAHMVSLDFRGEGKGSIGRAETTIEGWPPPISDRLESADPIKLLTQTVIEQARDLKSMAERMIETQANQFSSYMNIMQAYEDRDRDRSARYHTQTMQVLSSGHEAQMARYDRQAEAPAPQGLTLEKVIELWPMAEGFIKKINKPDPMSAMLLAMAKQKLPELLEQAMGGGASAQGIAAFAPLLEKLVASAAPAPSPAPAGPTQADFMQAMTEAAAEMKAEGVTG